MPSEPNALATLMFGIGLLAPVVLLVVGVVFALVVRTKS